MLDPALGPLLCSLLFWDSQWCLGVQKSENRMALTLSQPQGSPKQLLLSHATDCASPPPGNPVVEWTQDPQSYNAGPDLLSAAVEEEQGQLSSPACHWWQRVKRGGPLSHTYVTEQQTSCRASSLTLTPSGTAYQEFYASLMHYDARLASSHTWFPTSRPVGCPTGVHLKLAPCPSPMVLVWWSSQACSSLDPPE